MTWESGLLCRRGVRRDGTGSGAAECERGRDWPTEQCGARGPGDLFTLQRPAFACVVPATSYSDFDMCGVLRADEQR